jgi:hypothetical protein
MARGQEGKKEGALPILGLDTTLGCLGPIVLQAHFTNFTNVTNRVKASTLKNFRKAIDIYFQGKRLR